MERETLESMQACEQMDELVAFHVFDWGKGMERVGEFNIEQYIDKSTGIVMCQADKWEPSSDIEQAWKVCEKMALEDNHFFYDILAVNEPLEALDSLSASELICKAALLARWDEGKLTMRPADVCQECGETETVDPNNDGVVVCVFCGTRR